MNKTRKSKKLQLLQFQRKWNVATLWMVWLARAISLDRKGVDKHQELVESYTIFTTLRKEFCGLFADLPHAIP
jgi:hypothetical protein